MWDRVRELVGHVTEPTGHDRPRHLVRAFPGEAAIATVGMREMEGSGSEHMSEIGAKEFDTIIARHRSGTRAEHRTPRKPVH
jgi:hypothetical protein